MVSTVWLSPYSQTPTSGQFHICFETLSMAGKKHYLSGVQKKLRAFSFTICLCNLDFLGRIINTNSFPQIKGLDRIAGIYRCRHRFHVLCQQFSMVNCFSLTHRTFSKRKKIVFKKSCDTSTTVSYLYAVSVLLSQGEKSYIRRCSSLNHPFTLTLPL